MHNAGIGGNRDLEAGVGIEWVGLGKLKFGQIALPISIRVFLSIRDSISVAVHKRGIGTEFLFDPIGQSIEIGVVPGDDTEVVYGDSRYGMTNKQLTGI